MDQRVPGGDVRIWGEYSRAMSKVVDTESANHEDCNGYVHGWAYSLSSVGDKWKALAGTLEMKLMLTPG